MKEKDLEGSEMKRERCRGRGIEDAQRRVWEVGGWGNGVSE